MTEVVNHICILQVPQLVRIFPNSGVDRHGNTSTANWLGLDHCQQQTHVVEIRFATAL